jgi:DNA repair exonuclease SbcCD ATPase subunit
MSKNNDTLKDPTLIVEEIVNELEEVINKKKEEIEKDLEKRIQREKNKAKEKLDQIEKDLEVKKDELINYRTAFAKFENTKADIRSQKKEHLEKAIQCLRKIETLTAQGLEELGKMSELDQKLDEINHTVKEKAEIFKRELKEKFGVVAEKMETQENEETYLEQEREKLRKLRELLTSTNTSSRRRVKTRGKRESEPEAKESEVNKENETHPEESEDE